MVNVGRFTCVAAPFLLTLASLIAILVAGLAGITDKSLYMFQVDTANLTISSSEVRDIIGLKARDATSVIGQAVPDVAGVSGVPGVPAVPGASSLPDVSGLSGLLPEQKQSSPSGSTGNVTAADLGLYDMYQINIWNYCYMAQNGTRECTSPKYNWAQGFVNMSTGTVDSLLTATGKNVTLPKGVTDGINAFVAVSRWTEIVFIIATVGLGIELFFGLFAECSRAFSCITFVIALVATVCVCAFAALATAMSVVVVGTLEGTAKWYGVTSSFNGRFLAAIWLSVAFALAGAFFWLFTICCCAPDHRRRRASRDSTGALATRNVDGTTTEKSVPAGAYVPLGQGQSNPPMPQPYSAAYGQSSPQYAYASGGSGARHDPAYEPYTSK
ncbi:hypothetical protein P8C59_008041 [Phyllachora maydis]|uniref:Integral membrane protein n=1 Tax=Phyllachora maydis TaxID=1825666 RepID=A0AAD9IBF4_9PEZI|nr:hypothetical protein P8C59_008041 [Phyllachora maydis]